MRGTVVLGKQLIGDEYNVHLMRCYIKIKQLRSSPVRFGKGRGIFPPSSPPDQHPADTWAEVQPCRSSEVLVCSSLFKPAEDLPLRSSDLHTAALRRTFRPAKAAREFRITSKATQHLQTTMCWAELFNYIAS